MTNLNLLSDKQTGQLQALLGQSEKIVLCCHKSPDGDALGAMLGWAEYLHDLGKNPMLVAPDAFPDFLKWLPGNERVVRYDKHKDTVDEAFQQADLVFCLDFNSTKRVLDMQEALEASQAPKVLFDHHESPDVEAALSCSFPKLSSTCELVFRIIWQLGGFDTLSKAAAVHLYTGMMTDTGGFTYNSTRPEIYFIIGQLLTKKIDKDKIFRNVYNNYSEWCIRLRGYIMSQKLVVVRGSHACYYTLTKEEMKKYHFIPMILRGSLTNPSASPLMK